ncbi:hypothetical protein ABS768_08620 [Flavobacterium sp. ST-75]|uniref:KTSC domain-containing protein n=1 Tax=Flavobacterium rhizophilum TaxID=3163296 RepID=A0ABW8YED0_9FLAO
MSSFIEIPYGKEDVIINTLEIASIKSSGKSIVLKLTNGDSFTFAATLEKFRELLKPEKIEADRKTGVNLASMM